MSGNEKVGHASIVVPIRPGKMLGEIEVLAFLYTKQKRSGEVFTSWKFLTETGEAGESKWKTASNGVYREASAMPDDPNSLEFRALDVQDGEPLPFLVSCVLGDPMKGVEWHDKCVFLIILNPSCLSNLRKAEKMDGPLERLGAPEFVEAGELWRRMLERGQPFHRAVLFRVISRLARNPAIFARYRSILENPLSQEAMKTRGELIHFNE